ncbi:MAG: hypothetical protein J7493_00570 [Porphyrobacter sp.]|nr:hypothetical protein [Porphyrobacter sp.]
MRLTVTLALLSLGACTTNPAMETALAPLSGQPVQLVVAQLGPPTSSMPAGSDTVYEWRSAKFVYSASTRANLGPASEGGAPAYGGMAAPYTCDIKVLADAQGRIKDTQFGEQTGGCRESAKKLSQLAYADPR